MEKKIEKPVKKAKKMSFSEFVAKANIGHLALDEKKRRYLVYTR